jgi:hypothetical protein
MPALTPTSSTATGDLDLATTLRYGGVARASAIYEVVLIAR